MEKAKITKSGNGWELDFKNGKKPTIFNCTNIRTAWENKEIKAVIVERHRIILKKDNIYLLGEVIRTDRGINLENENVGNNIERPHVIDSARAPYNFVPLNKTVVYPDKQTVLFDRFELNSGYIDVEVKNLTSLMISKGVNPKDPNRTHDFLRIGKENKVIIPGSSLRGLIKLMVGVVSYSMLTEGEQFSDHALFYRGVADRAFTNIYQPKFFDLHNNHDYKPLAGLLKKEGNTYRIFPANVDSFGNQYYKIRNNAHHVSFNHLTRKPVFNFDGQNFENYTIKDIFFIPKPKRLHNHNGRELKYALVTEFSFRKTDPLFVEGKLVITGGMGRRKHDQWVVNLSSIHSIPIPEEVIKEYISDNQRESEFDILEKLKTSNNCVPCFYLTENNEVASFGHTPLYRIKHTKSIKDAVNQKTDIGKYDFEQLIFGNTEKFASRVYFEDLIIENNNKNQLERKIIKILASPKPTSHQLYLKQNGIPLKNWSSNQEIEINGIKQYWHKNVNENYWKDNVDSLSGSHTGYIKPIKPNNTFKGRIRFENLTDEELGALLFALELPENCCHKIGLGKPLGLGTIRISTKLNLEDKNEKYSKLISENGEWFLPVKSTSVDFKKTFTDLMLSKIGNDKKDLWEVDRLSEFKAMLEYDENTQSRGEWLNKTSYMDLPMFTNREILNNPKKIKGE